MTDKTPTTEPQTTTNDPITLTQTARWTTTQMAPSVLFVALAGAMVYLGISGSITILGSIISTIFFFAVAYLVLHINLTRKRKSTINAVLHQNGDVHIWINEPIRARWGAKMNEDFNKGNISKIFSIKMFTAITTRAAEVSTAGGKNIYLPQRLFEEPQFRKYLAQQLQKQKNTILFDNVPELVEFEKLVGGPSGQIKLTNTRIQKIKSNTEDVWEADDSALKAKKERTSAIAEKVTVIDEEKNKVEELLKQQNTETEEESPTEETPPTASTGHSNPDLPRRHIAYTLDFSDSDRINKSLRDNENQILANDIQKEEETSNPSKNSEGTNASNYDLGNLLGNTGNTGTGKSIKIDI